MPPGQRKTSTCLLRPRRPVTRLLVLLVLLVSGACREADAGFRDVPVLIGIQADEPLHRNGVIYLSLFGGLDSDQLLVSVEGATASVETRYCRDACDPENNDACVSQRCIIMARSAELVPPSASVLARSADGTAESFIEVEVLDSFDTEPPVVELPVISQGADGLVTIDLQPEADTAAQVVLSADGEVVETMAGDSATGVVSSDETCFQVVALDFAGQEGRSAIACMEPTSGCQSAGAPLLMVLLAWMVAPRRRRP